MSSAQSLARRFKSRLQTGLSLIRAYRFVAELEPSPGEDLDPFVAMAGEFRVWRKALRADDIEAGLDAVERTWALIEACRQRVIGRDAAIEAFRVRWACENASLRLQTINSLARFYRVLPFSTSSQSKYEYVLTRLLAGPIGPERKVAPTEVLKGAVVALEAAWGAPPIAVEENEVATIALALRYFASEATRHTDVATFTASGLLRRFGAYKASIGEAMFDPRLSVAVVETNVAVLNVLNQLLTHAGGQPQKWTASAEQTPPPVDYSKAGESHPLTALVDESAESEARRKRFELLTGEVDLSGLDFIREAALASLGEPAAAPTAPPRVAPIESSSEEAPTRNQAGEETRPALAEYHDLKTGEVDLSGLEFVRRRPRPKPDPGPEPQPAAPDEGSDASETPGAEVPAPVAEVAQQPSVRAFELARVEENAAIIDRYMTGPRSPEVWQLDLDVFLGHAGSGDVNSETSAAERRRALELILASDDLICQRTNQREPPTAEHRAKVKSVANGMLLLRTSLRRFSDLAQGDPRELATLLYAADHLLWERLRLEASLKQISRRQRPSLLPRLAQAAEAAQFQMRLLRRHRQILVRIVLVAVALATIARMISGALPALPVDPEVSLIQLEELPGAGLFDDVRAFRTTLFVSASRTWALLGREERRSVVRALGAFAAERGFDSVSVAGPDGEPAASFKDEEAILDDELNFADLAAR